MPYTDEQLIEKLKQKNPPADIQLIILDEHFGPEITLIGQELGVEIGKTFDIEDETVSVLLGETKEEEFASKIESVGVDRETAQKIANEIDKSIFDQVRDSLSEVQGKGSSSSNVLSRIDSSVSQGAEEIITGNTEVGKMSVGMDFGEAKPFREPPKNLPRTTDDSEEQEVEIPEIPNIPALQKPIAEEKARPSSDLSDPKEAPSVPENIFEQKLQSMVKETAQESLVSDNSSAEQNENVNLDPYREPPT